MWNSFKTRNQKYIIFLQRNSGGSSKRWISAEINGILICNLYLPNGNPLGTEKFEYKIHWMNLLYNYLKELQSIGKPIVIMGDFNIIPQDIDCKSPKKWINDALYDMDARSIFLKY